MKTLKALAAVIAVLVLAVASYEGIARPFIQNCGSQGDEATPALPGDDIVQTAAWQGTRPISIAAPASEGPSRLLTRDRSAAGMTASQALMMRALMQPDPIVGAILLCALWLALVPFRGLTPAPPPREPVTAVRVSSHRRTPREWLLVASIASVIVYGLGDVASGLLYDGYSYKDQWISELTAFGSPVRLVMVTAILVHGVLLLAFGVGIWRAADRRTLRWIGLLLMLAGMIGFPTHTVFPMSSRWMTPGFNDTMHALLSLTFSLIVFTAVVLSAVAFKGWFRLCSIATIPVLVGFGAASAAAIQGIAQNSTPWAGAFERINAYAYFAWLILLAVTVTRRSVDRGRRHSDVENEHTHSDRVGHIVQQGKLRA